MSSRGRWKKPYKLPESKLPKIPTFEEFQERFAKLPPHVQAEMNALAERAVKAKDERIARRAKMTPEELAEDERKMVEAAAAFIMDTRLGGP